MFSRGIRTPLAKEEGEKPFWISYADLMTAMMMLFLIVMTFSLVIITNPGPELEHLKKIQQICDEIKTAAKDVQGVTVDCINNRIDFGVQAQFSNNDSKLPDNAKQKLREFVPILLTVARKDLGKLLKRVVVEGYASPTGSYLLNLQLSMRRAETVLCSLFEAPKSNEILLSIQDKQMVRDLFLVGGYSFNNGQGKSAAEMRRVEFKLDFLGFDEQPPATNSSDMDNYGQCQ
ncbi:MAG: flagellar motor protein MotB [Methylobacter sp.]|nr:MAG: flagellar motor protein MotB [Methylobacter sp.]